MIEHCTTTHKHRIAKPR